jgi:tetratricopeptide (TPR) repeat protein
MVKAMKGTERAEPLGGASAADCPTGSTGRDQGNLPPATPEGVTGTCCSPASWRLTVLAAGLIVLAALAAYHNSFAGPFVYDDATSIAENGTIRQLWPIWPALSPPRHGQTVAGRPLLNLSLAINYALGALDVRGYHVANLLIHIAAALLLFGILRRTFLLPVLRDRFGSAAAALALASALIWAVHPLQTESVTYIVQRAESLAGLFYLLTLYGVIRGAGEESLATSPLSLWERVRVRAMVGKAQTTARVSGTSALTPALSRRERETSEEMPSAVPGHPPAGESGPLFWYSAAVLACLLGMACKEVMVTAPLMVLLYDRTFLAGSFAEAFRRRWGLYLGLAATWGLLACLVFSTGLIHRRPEFGVADPWSYARSQPGVILHYLRLSVWPSPLCFNYEWPVANTCGEIIPGAIAVAALLATTLWGLMGRKPWGFLGAWLLLILAPTSSIMPLGQLAFEHRMYLSLGAVAVLAVVGGYILWEKFLCWSAGRRGQSPFSPEMTPGKVGLRAAEKGTVPGLTTIIRWAAPVVVLAMAVLALGCATVVRNQDYRSLIALYHDTVEKRPNNPVAHNNLGFALAAEAMTAAAIEQYREALRLKPAYVEAHNNLGNALAALGKSDKAIEQYQAALRLRPHFAPAHNNLGAALNNAGRVHEAIEHCREALRLKPDYFEADINLGNALVNIGRVNEAIAHYREALRLKPDNADAHNNLGNALAGAGKLDEAVEHYREAVRLTPDDPLPHSNLGKALAKMGKSDEAIKHFHEAVRLNPEDVEALNKLGLALADAGRVSEAIEQYREALRRKPDYAEARNNLGNALANTGRVNEAIEQYQEVLRRRPDHAGAHNNLGVALAAVGRTDEAIEHYHQALRLKPDDASARNNLGVVLAATGRTDEAIEQFREALRLKGDHADARYNLGLALTAAGKTSEAIAHYGRFLQLRPDAVEALNDLAWLLASHEAAEGGDPQRAVRLAERARELSGRENAQCLDTLAAAYAAAGRFADGVETAERAVRLAETAGQTVLANRIRLRLELYRAGRAYREGQPSAEPTK